MATYCFVCRICGLLAESRSNSLAGTECPDCGIAAWKRDYRAENVGIGAGVRASRMVDAADILPSAADFASPDDPDGTKGLRQWNNDFAPAPGNKNPKRPGGRAIKQFF